MPQGDVQPLGLAAAALLVVVAIVLSVRQHLGLERTIGWAALRALVQLLIVGAGLSLIIAPGAPLAYSWLWVAAMVIYASGLVKVRAPEVPRLVPLALLAFAASMGVAIGVLFALQVFPLEPRTLVPLSGMVTGNSMASAVLVSRRIVDELRSHRPEVEARLALGQPSSQAARPFVRSALRSALTPQIETTKAVGIVALPGAMTGLILAGVDPLQAVMVQVVVMYLILGSVATTTTVMALGLSRRLFTEDHRLVSLPTTA